MLCRDDLTGGPDYREIQDAIMEARTDDDMDPAEMEHPDED